MDWNNNGRRDDFDRMMDYNSFYSSQNTTPDTNSGGCLSIITVALVIILIMGFIGSAFNACSKKSTYKSSYKYHYTPHSYSSSTYSKPSYSSNSTSKYSNYSSSSGSTSSYNSKNKYSSSYKSKNNYSSNDDTDEYNAKDYVDADDFYYDHYDDFYDYEDAEDYYDDHYDD